MDFPDDSQQPDVTEDDATCALQLPGDTAASNPCTMRTSQLLQQGGQLPSGLIPETEPELFLSQGVTGSVSVAQPLHQPAAPSAPLHDDLDARTEHSQCHPLQHQQQQPAAPQQQQQHQHQQQHQQRPAPSAQVTASVASAGAVGGAGWCPPADFDDDDLDDLLREHQEQQQQQQQQQHAEQAQQQRPQIQQQQLRPQPQQQRVAAGGWDDDELDDMLQEQQEMQQEMQRHHHQQQQQQQQQRQASRQQQQAWDYPLDDPDDLLADMEPPPQQHQQQHHQQQGNRGSPVPAGRHGAAAAAADLDAELDDLLAEAAGAQRPGRGAAAAAAAGGAGGGPEMDFDEELEALFDGDTGAGPRGAPTCSQAMPPPPPKPVAVASLGVGGAAAASRRAAAAAALSALQAAALPPRQLASEVTGRSVTVTGTTGARVYCQLAAPAAAAAAAAGSSGGGSSRRGGLLHQPIGELLDILAERRRQEVIAEVEAAQAAVDRVEAAARGEPDGSPDDGAQEQGDHQQQQQQEAYEAAAAAAAAAPVPRELWVDKYAPKSFLALLSEPRINREIAAWMARWHKQHTQPHGQQQQQQQRPPKQQLQQQQQQQPHAQQQGGRGGAGRGRGAAGPGTAAGGRGAGRSGGSTAGAGEGGRQVNISRGFDAARYKALQEARAAARVLLVVGPPGTCKTTLAHVIARHCGFRVVEVNASDARTASSLTRAVVDAAEMAPVLDSSRRRPCIVLDELDGAAGGAEGHSAVAALVKLLTGEGRSKKRKRGAKGPAASSAGGGGLSVPVICTANDAFAPCLRPLKDIAAVYHFKPPAADKLAARLGAIAAAEGVSLDKQALSALVEHSGSDVRTAINTLQLLARQHAPSRPLSSSRPHTPSSSQQGASQRRGQRVRITAADIAASGVFGVKDVTHTPLGVVQDMLASNGSRAMAARLQHLAAAMKAEQRGAAGPSRHGRRGAEPPASLSAAAAARLALQEHYNTLLDLGEHEQVMSVLHESLPDLVGLDVDLACTTAAADALADADLLMASGRGGAGGGAGSWQYVPAPLLTVVGLVRRDAAGVGVMGSAGLHLAWPRAQAECSRSSTAVLALLRSWRAGSPAHAARALGSSADGLLDLAPALRDISRPAAVRAVNAQLLSREEDRVLGHVVDVLVAYGLTYSFPLDEEEDGSRAPRPAPLAPAVDTLHTYCALPQPVARFLGDRRALKPGWARGSMPLMMRQMLAQRISTAVITRLEQARHAGEEQGAAQTPGKTAAAARTPLAPKGPPKQQQQPAAHSKGRGAAASSKPAPLPKAPKGCWLDTLKVQAAAKRKAAILAVGASKRAALGQGPKPAAAAAAPGAELEACTPPEGGAQEAAAGADGGGHNGYTVLYKFNEGYTNAVKRPIKMAELMF